MTLVRDIYLVRCEIARDAHNSISSVPSAMRMIAEGMLEASKSWWDSQVYAMCMGIISAYDIVARSKKSHRRGAMQRNLLPLPELFRLLHFASRHRAHLFSCARRLSHPDASRAVDEVVSMPASMSPPGVQHCAAAAVRREGRGQLPLCANPAAPEDELPALDYAR